MTERRVAAEDPGLKGIVLMAGPSQTGREILEFQNRYAIEHNPAIKPEARDSAIKAALVGIDSIAKTSPWIKFFMEHDPSDAAKVKAQLISGRPTSR
jgi:hypothetical protein